MGCSNSKVEPSKGPIASSQPGGTAKGVGGGRTGGNRNFKAIEDKFETLEEVSDSLKVAGLESSNLVRGGRLFFFSWRGGRKAEGPWRVPGVVPNSPPSPHLSDFCLALLQTPSCHFCYCAHLSFLSFSPGTLAPTIQHSTTNPSPDYWGGFHKEQPVDGS